MEESQASSLCEVWVSVGLLLPWGCWPPVLRGNRAEEASMAVNVTERTSRSPLQRDTTHFGT